MKVLKIVIHYICGLSPKYNKFLVKFTEVKIMEHSTLTNLPLLDAGRKEGEWVNF